MKTTLLILSTIVICLQTRADCNNHGIYYWPSLSIVEKNQVFLVGGYDIYRLQDATSVVLRTGNYEVPIQLEKFQGENDAQILIQPKQSLIPGKSYNWVLKDANGKVCAESKPYFVSNTDDTISPLLASPPQFLAKRFVSYGCGIETSFLFDMPVVEANPYLIKISLKEMNNRSETTFFEMPYCGKIIFGREMCGGFYTFDDKCVYQIKLSAMDMCGNYSKVLLYPKDINGPCASDTASYNRFFVNLCEGNDYFVQTDLIKSETPKSERMTMSIRLLLWGSVLFSVCLFLIKRAKF